MQVIPVCVKKEITPSDDLAQLILDSVSLEDGDIIVAAQKVISKNENQIILLSSITPSLLACGIASQYEKDPRVVEIILSESKKIVRMSHGVIIVQTRHGFVCANAGVDESNVKQGYACLLPVDSDVSAKKLCDKIKDVSGKNIPVIVSDTFGRPFRMGQTNCAIGISGLSPMFNYAGTLDAFDRCLRVTEIAVADELCAAAELVMKKTSFCPFVVIRGYSFDNVDSSISKVIRPQSEDLFL